MSDNNLNEWFFDQLEHNRRDLAAELFGGRTPEQTGTVIGGQPVDVPVKREPTANEWLMGLINGD